MDILETRLVKRGIAVKSLDYQKVEPAAGRRCARSAKIQQGILSEKAKEIVKAIKDREAEGAGVHPGRPGPRRGTDKDELQEVMALLRGRDFGLPLQFTNYR